MGKQTFLSKKNMIAKLFLSLVVLFAVLNLNVMYKILVTLLFVVFSIMFIMQVINMGKLFLMKKYFTCPKLYDFFDVKNIKNNEFIQKVYESMICFSVVSYFTILLIGTNSAIMSFIFLTSLVIVFLLKMFEEKFLVEE